MADAQDRVALIEIVERDGRVRQQLDVQRWPLSIGRALDRDLVLDDPHVAAQHARLDVDDDGRLWLAVGDTHNGVRVGRRTLHRGERLELAAGSEALHFGHTRLRVRRTGDPLPAEKPLVGLSSARSVAVTIVLTLLLWGVLLAQHWIASDPGADLSQWLPVLLGPAGVLALWCGAWALASKLFQHRFEFAAHWAHAVRWTLGITLSGVVVTLGAAAVGSPQLFRMAGTIEAALAMLWLFGHARLVLPTHTRALAISFACAFAVGLVVTMLLNQQREERLVGPLYMHVLPHPTLRIARPQTPQAFVEGARGLKARVDAQARSDADEDEPVAPPEGGS